MNKKINILFIEDGKDMQILIVEELKKTGYEIFYEEANSLDSIKAAMEAKTWDVVICSSLLKDISTLKALFLIKRYDAYLPFILMSEEIDCKSIIKFMKNGCNNYISIRDITKIDEIIESEINEVNRKKYNFYKKIKREKEGLELIIQSIGDGVIITDNQGVITKINKAAEAITEWDSNSAIGMDLNKVFKLADNKIVADVLNISLHSGIKNDAILVSKSDKKYYISANYSAIVDKKLGMLGAVIIFRDTTKIKKLENDLRDDKKQAQAENKAKSAFLASMSHEIRTPLNGISGMIDLTLLTELTDEQRENLNIAKECSDSLMEVINNVLDFSKIEAEKMEIKKTKFNIKDLIERIVKTNIVHARNKGIDLISDIDPNFIKTYLGDCGKIEQILNNLISNAIKFTSSGNVCLTAKILKEQNDTDLLRFTVADTGIGIAAEDMNKLFKSFSQVDGTYTRQYGGTGLGLIISKKLAELMEGEISVESIKNKGSTFHLTIEIEKLEDLNEIKDSVKDEYQDNNLLKISRKVLIVEDNKANQHVLYRMCTKMNHKVKIADDGRKALDILNEEDFDIILMDIQMPVMNGIDATRVIRESEKKSGKHIPIIALTAYALKGDREKFLKIGMDDYLSKPVIMDDLYKAIEAQISKQKIGTFHSAEYYLDIVDTNNNHEDEKIFIENIHIELDKLRTSVQEENFIICEKSVHRLKEYSQCVKSVIMKNASFRAELAARRKDIKGLKEQLVIIEEEYTRIKKSV